MAAELDQGLLGEAGVADAGRRVRGCSRPVRLRGSTQIVERATGQVREVYGSRQELDGVTYVRCGNRRAAVCPSCSQEYKADGWHLIVCGLMGGKGVPADVADRPCTFVTLTAPSFGPVHGVRGKGVCRARRERPVCTHGRPMWCNRRHNPAEAAVGEPLCVECYDYVAHVVWQFHANELWRRFLITLQRRLATAVGLSVTELRSRLKVSFSKVVEFQARGAVHVHAPMRLDGPGGPDGPPTDLAVGRGRARAGGPVRRYAGRRPLVAARGRHRLRAAMGHAGGHPHDLRRGPARRSGPTSGASGAGGVVPGQVPHQGDRGLRPRRHDPFGPARRAHQRHSHTP